VDDIVIGIVITWDDIAGIEELKQQLKREFEVKY
jgi:SpoVK/Ycf46/Vps4 family AAA+-type ATPase